MPLSRGVKKYNGSVVTGGVQKQPHNMFSVFVGSGRGHWQVYKPCKSWERNNGLHVTSMTTSFLSFQNLILTSLLLTGNVNQ